MTTTTPAPATKRGAKNKKAPRGLTMTRHFTTAGVHPYDTVEWTMRDIVQTDWRSGTTIFEQRGVEFPATWSENAATIATTKYFRGAQGSDTRERSLKQLIDRVVCTYRKAGQDNGYFSDEASADIFEDELRWMLVHQYFAFNSPVWFNVGTSSPQQVSACFILAVSDTMDSILNWYREEGLIFKGGSGAGLNLSSIRSSKELLSSGGHASGPVSFMRGADASAGTIKSGGATRRAAKMVVLDVDHPDIEEFVETKAREEDKIRALRDAGFDMDLSGRDIVSVQYQNANNSVRVDDAFMRAVEDNRDYPLRARNDGSIIDTVNARELFGKIAQAAWACADPGIQYKDTINAWHTNPNTGPITASNPCSEYMSLDDSSCNLASLNLMKFLSDDGVFNTDAFAAAVDTIITAMDISICFADFPTDKIGETTRNYRQLGIGYSNLGAMLMALGYAYDSDEGRDMAAAITSLMTAAAYKRSAILAGVVGPYNGYKANEDAHKRVITKHVNANFALRALTDTAEPIMAAATGQWDKCEELGARYGYRNAQASLLAPTGTIGFLMDCDTTGIEPDFALIKHKKLVGGGSMDVVNGTVTRALQSLGYDEATVDGALAQITKTGHVAGAPGIADAHLSVFDCAVGDRAITAGGHIHMMAAVQPFLSGAISKTVNLPQDATVEDIAGIYLDGWKLGLKAVAVYRDNCKVGQPLSEKNTAADEPAAAPAVHKPVRNRLPQSRAARTTSFRVGDVEGYMTTGEYTDGSLGEVFIKVSKQGSTLAGIMDGLAMAVSVALQYGVPLETFVAKYVNSAFEPSGMTNDTDVRIAKSILDYVFRRLAIDYLDTDTRHGFGIYTVAERINTDVGATSNAAVVSDTSASVPAPAPAAGFSLTLDAPLCATCGSAMQRSGSCFACSSCGNTSGCS